MVYLMIFHRFLIQTKRLCGFNLGFSFKPTTFGARVFLCIGLGISLSACGSAGKSYVPNLIKPYRFDIQQGNFITDEDVAKLKIGMSQDDVRFVLGTPLVTSPFHQNRWDYIYRVQKANSEVVQYRYTLIFENDVLAKHGGQDLPNTQAELVNDPIPIRNFNAKK